MVDTAGTQLRRARTLRQLSLEDAARATKIRARQLADLEGDEYSNFANLAYAKGFLVSYGKYLHVDVRPYLDAFADASTFGLDDYQYLSATPVGEYRAPTRAWRRKRKPVRLLLAGTLVAAVAVAACTSFLYVSYQRLGDLGQLAERQQQHGTGGGGNGEAVKPAAAIVPAAGDTAVGDASAPLMVPVSSTPVPSPAPAAPDVAPSNEDTRAAATALAISEHSPTALLSQLALPPGRGPGVAANGLSDGAGAKPLASPAAGNDSLFVHAPDAGTDAFRRSVPKAQPVSNNSVQ